MDRYSRWVAIFKVLLPLTALGLLATLFLLSNKVDPEATIPFAEREISDRLRDQQITAPSFVGTSRNGEDYHVSAAKISPPLDGKPARAVDLKARLERQQGVTIRIRSARGTYDDVTARATFLDDVIIRNSIGYVVETQKLVAEMDGSRATSPGKVHGTGPVGSFSAGEMEIFPKSDGQGLQMVFRNGVRLVYDPKAFER